jgi:hypothetical protein
MPAESSCCLQWRRYTANKILIKKQRMIKNYSGGEKDRQYRSIRESEADRILSEVRE